MDRTIENEFFNWFRHDGAFCSCLNAVIWKYDLGDFKDMCSHLTKEDITQCEQNALSKCGELTVNFQLMYEEIQDNFSSCSTAQSKENYCQDLLQPFSKFAHSVLPVTNNFQVIGERANEIEKGLSNILHNNIKENSIEWHFRFFRICVEEYSIMLDWVLMKNGIDLMTIQDKFNIHIKNGRRVTEFIKWGGNFETVQYYLNSLPSKGILAINTPTFDFLCQNIDSRLKAKFISFCLIRSHNKIELDDTNKVLILKKIVGNIKERLKANKLQMKGLWLELKRLNVISATVSNDTLNKAARSVSKVKPEILNDWDKYLQNGTINN